MAIKDILQLHLDAWDARPCGSISPLRLAARSRRRILTGMFVVDVALPPVGEDVWGCGGVLASLLEERRAAALADAARAEAAFQRPLRARGHRP